MVGWSAAKGYEDWIEIVAYEQGLQSQPSPRALASPGLQGLAEPWRSRIRLSGPEATRPGFSYVWLTKQVDRASPVLALGCARGTAYKDARLELVRLAGDTVVLARVELKDVRVSRVDQASASDLVGLSESVALSFGEIRFTSVELSASGGPLAQHTARWDLAAGEGSFETGPYEPGGDGMGPTWLLARNLLVNPDAESGPGASSLLAVVPPPGWQTFGGLTTLAYGAAASAFEGGTTGPDARGLSLFAGGPDSAVSLARQVVDVSAAAPLADARRLKAVLEGWLGGVGGEDDATEVTAAFLRADGTPLGTLGLGPVTRGDRRGLTGLVHRDTQSRVPPGTRQIEVTLRMTRFNGSYNDGVAENLELTLLEGSGAPARLPLRVASFRGSSPGEPPKLQCSWPAGLELVIIQSAAQLDGEWSIASPAVRVEGGERSFEVPVEDGLPFRFWRIRAEE